MNSAFRHQAGNLLAQSGKYSPRYEGAWLRLESVIVLPQPRKTFEGIEELAEDVAKKRLLNPPTVARFSPDNFVRYLETVNLLWGTCFSPEDKVFQKKATLSKGEKAFYVLLAGERRFRSCRHLWNEGCADCLDRFGKEESGICFRRHFGGDKIEVRLCSNIPPIDALFLQLSENTHMQVPPHEEAHAYTQLFRLLRKTDPEISVTRFARNVGRSPEKIRGALRFCELPLSIQSAVEAGRIPYGIALEIARLQEAGINDEAELQRWSIRAVIERKPIPEFRGIVSEFLFHRSSGQASLEFMGMLSDSELWAKKVRMVVGRNLIGAVWTWFYYLSEVLRLFEEGKIGPDLPFSEKSPERIFRTLIARLEDILPHLDPHLPKRKRDRLKAAIQQMAADLAAEDH